MSSLVAFGCGDDSSGDTAAGSSTGAEETTTGPVATTDTPTPPAATTTGTTPDTTSGADSSGGDSGDTGETGEEGMADIDMTVVLDQTLESVYTDTVEFQEGSCEVTEMCVMAPGERRLLRFDTLTPNLGDADFYVGNPTNNPDAFEIGCGGGPVFQNYAAYRLLSTDRSEVIAVGHKAAFALIDVAPWTEDAGPAQYGFGEDMGISVGWVDIYGAGLACQYVDITGVPAGDYLLEISINFEQEIEEQTYDNNILLAPVTITDEDTGGAPDGWNCDPGFFGTSDGCDCGCGLQDPDCADATVDSCQYCGNGGACSMTCDDINPKDNSTCTMR
ncbi:MAG: lysyl oxidase family protein [Myxococcota bacterium]